MWLCTSACIRIVDTRTDAVSHALSAIYIVDTQESGPSDSFCLSISHLPPEAVDSTHKMCVAAPHLHGNGDVVWLAASNLWLVPVFSASNDPLYEYLKHALQSGFNFLPLDSLAGNSMLLLLNLIKVLCRNIYTEANRDLFRPFTPSLVSTLDPIIVRSSPFNFTNASMFADFVSSGNVNYTFQDGNTLCGLLSDVKYLENMSGAMVTTPQDRAVGLLLGNLRKLNGDGDLLVIVPWERLLQLFDKINPGSSKRRLPTSVISSQQTMGSIMPVQNAIAGGRSVLPLTLSRGDHGMSWGSCILLNSKTLVTNFHVIRPYLEEKGINCEIQTQKSVVRLDNTDEVIVPFKSLDLAFIQLSQKHQNQLAHVKPPSLSFSSGLKIGDRVLSSGYGLLLNRDFADPIQSAGHVSSKLELKPFHDSPKIPCMLITSSSCWNGSSGGGLFNERGCLVGIICSNAQVFVPALNGDVISKTEKVPLFCLSIPLELILECYQKKVVESVGNYTLDSRVEKAWKLETFHQDIFEREAKL